VAEWNCTVLLCEWWQRNGEFPNMCIKDRRKKTFMVSKYYYILIFSTESIRPKRM
jgi:hypothetical protein